MQIEDGSPGLAAGKFVELPPDGIGECRSRGQGEGRAVEADDPGLRVGEHETEVEGVEGLPPLVRGQPQVGFETALVLLGSHLLRHVADGAHPNRAAPVGQGARPHLHGQERAVAPPGAVVVGLLGTRLEVGLHDCLIFGGDELPDRPADEVGHLAAQHPRELLVRVHERPCLGDGDPLESRPRQPLESLLAFAERLVGAFALDRGSENGGRGLQRLDLGGRPLPLVPGLPEAQESPPRAAGEDGDGREGLRPHPEEKGLLRLREALHQGGV